MEERLAERVPGDEDDEAERFGADRFGGASGGLQIGQFWMKRLWRQNDGTDVEC